MTKVKKTVRDREKEISRLRTEISAFRKIDGNIANNAGNIKQEQNNNVNINGVGSSNNKE